MPNTSSIVCISEILRLVCECADPPTLASMARSSRIVHEAAVQVLWRNLPDLFPLIRCFPDDAWTLIEDFLERILHIERPLVPREWTSFLKHSALVRVLGYGPIGSPRWYRSFVSRYGLISPSKDLWDKLCACCPTPLIFPNLRALRWKPLGLPYIRLAPFLISVGHYLQEIDAQDDYARFEDTADTHVAVHHTIIDRFPHLRRFSFRQLSSPEPQVWLSIQESIADLVRSLTSLVSFTWSGTPLSESVLVVLARSETLSSLTLRLPDDHEQPHDTTLSTVKQPFQYLRHLNSCGTMQAHYVFSNTVHLPTVHKAYVQLSENFLPLTMSFMVFSASLRQQFCPRTLTVLKIDYGTPPHATSDQEVEATILRSDDLRPLLEFTCLESFTLISLGTLSLDDAFILEMVAAWPALRTLTLNCFNCRSFTHIIWRGMTLPSLRILTSFASRCANLQKLSLCLNASCWSSHEDFLRDVEQGGAYGELQGRPSQCPLTTFCANYSPINSPESVATFLSYIFPKLVRVNAYCSPWKEPTYSVWQAVDTHFAPRRTQ
ncbi:hypothetical protein C8Q73DRAFT_763124 [Cubamyces lactineus]|nr:hypothetical protein C8Q73DRAFT_763124 [Cubamyces lactineus]